MKTLFVEKEIKYIGSQLSPHWIYRNFNILGDAIVSFVGEVDVQLDEMVDIEDVINNEPIYRKCLPTVQAIVTRAIRTHKYYGKGRA